MIRKRWKLLAVVFILLLIVNAVPRSRSMAFEQHAFPDSFGTSFGFPVSALATTGDKGVELIKASVVFADSTTLRDVLPGSYPHISVNHRCLFANLVFASVFLMGTYVFSVASEKWRDKRALDNHQLRHP